MKYFFYLIVFFAIHVGFTQNTIIETGRPKTFIVRNSQEIAGKKFKIKYEYVAFKRDSQLDSISKNNNATYEKLQKKYGNDWREKIDKEVKYELENLNLFLALLKKNNQINDDNVVYFKKSGCGNKYIAEIYPAIEPENRSKENLQKKVCFQQKDGKTVMK